LNAEATSYIPGNDLATTEAMGNTVPVMFGYHSTSQSTASVTVNDENIWTNDAGQQYIPSQGPWGIIPSRSVMIGNLPKTTQLWTLVELLKVSPRHIDDRDWEIELVFSPRLFYPMGLPLYHSMIFVMPRDVSVTFGMIVSSPVAVLILTLSRQLLFMRYFVNYIGDIDGIAGL
jgi:hypothetical protein